MRISLLLAALGAALLPSTATAQEAVPAVELPGFLPSLMRPFEKPFATACRSTTHARHSDVDPNRQTREYISDHSPMPARAVQLMLDDRGEVVEIRETIVLGDTSAAGTVQATTARLGAAGWEGVRRLRVFRDPRTGEASHNPVRLERDLSRDELALIEPLIPHLMAVECPSRGSDG